MKQFKVTRWMAGCKHTVLLLPWQFEWKYLRGPSQAWNFHKVHFQASIEYTDRVWKQRGRLVTFIVVVKAAAEGELKGLAQDLLLQHSKEKTLRKQGEKAGIHHCSGAWRLKSYQPAAHQGLELLLDVVSTASEMINQSYKTGKIRHQKSVTHPLKHICETVNQTPTTQQIGSWHCNVTCGAN